MMTDKSNCAQLKVIFQSLDQQSCPSYLHCGVLQIDSWEYLWRVKKEKPERKWKRKGIVAIIILFDVKIT